MGYRPGLILAFPAVLMLAVSTVRAGTASVAEEPPRHGLLIPQFAGAAKFGCDLNQAPWTSAARTTGLLGLNSRRLSAFPTDVYACYDRSALWLAFRCAGIDGTQAKTEATQRDGRVWWDDSVEFYCSPDHSRRHFVQFSANAAGVMYDGKNTDGSWNAEWQAASAVDASGYTVAMRIPFAALGVRSPREGDTWRVNFARHGPISGASSWMWAYNGLHDPRQFGELIFGGRQARPARVTGVAPWSMGRNVVELEGGSGLTGRFTGRDENGTAILDTKSRAEGSRIAFALGDDRVRTIEALLENGKGEVLARWWSDVHTAELEPRLADWTQRFETMQRVRSRFAAGTAARAQELIAAAEPRLAEARRLAGDEAGWSRETWERLGQILDTFDKELGDLSNYARTLEHFPRASFGVGLESSMRQVMIRDFPFRGWVDRQAKLALAANEREAVQVVIMPFDRDVRNVRVRASVSSPGPQDAGIACQVSLIGHVNVDDDPPYVTTYKEFYPDPLLSFLQTADVKAGEHVAFWVEVGTGKRTPAGAYTGRIEITADGCEPVELDLDVTVWDFALIDGTHLRNAFTYHEHMIGSFHRGRWDRDMARAYQDIILDHRLGIDHLYRKEPPDLSTLQRAVGKGMNAFNIVFAGSGGARDRVVQALTEFVPRIRQAGLFDLAYLYGFDEIKADKFKEARELFEEARRLVPGLPTMTTAQDHSFGKESGLREAVDIWVPLTPNYDVLEAEELRREGKQMWWYICIVPVHPYANWFVEHPVIESRLLMGAMSYKYQVDGFLYYLVNNGWERNKKPISSGPYTEWDPASCANSKGKWANGDGNLIYPGPDGPLASMRLANIRDGLEDYEYLYILAEQVSKVERLPATADRTAFLASARPLLAVPDSVVRNVVEYTYRPESLAQWRAKMAELIVAGRGLLGE